MTTFSTDPALYIFTSLTAGSSHIVTATSRLETILRANRVPFKAVDLATDEKARMLWGRRAGKDEGGRVRKLPGLVQEAVVLGDLVEIEEWNEYGELKQHVKIYYDEFTIPSINNKPPSPKLKARKKAVTGSASSTTKKASLSKSSAGATTGTGTGTPAPTPPPLPDSKTPTTIPKSAADTATGDNSEMKKTEGKGKTGESKVLPMRSVADEAAQKAKELRLKSLREKVHGKEGKKTNEAEETAASKGKDEDSNQATEKRDMPLKDSPPEEEKEETGKDVPVKKTGTSDDTEAPEASNTDAPEKKDIESTDDEDESDEEEEEEEEDDDEDNKTTKRESQSKMTDGKQHPTKETTAADTETPTTPQKAPSTDEVGQPTKALDREKAVEESSSDEESDSEEEEAARKEKEEEQEEEDEADEDEDEEDEDESESEDESDKLKGGAKGVRTS